MGPRTTTNFARNASARTAPTSQRVTTVSSQSRKDAVHRTGKAMETVTITTITLVAAGMAATVAVRKITNTARNANARTAHTSRKVISVSTTSRKAVALPSSRETASVMTTTTLAAALGTAATAVETKRTSNIASCVSAETARRRSRKIVPERKAASSPTTRKMGTVTTKITIVDVIGTEVTAAPRPITALSTPNIARLALAWTQRTRATLTARAIANSRNTKEMATAMTRTITAAASTMEAIAVPKPCLVAKSRRHTASSASAWIPRPHRAVRARASSRITKEMATATTRTITAVARTMAVIAVPRLSKGAKL